MLYITKLKINILSIKKIHHKNKYAEKNRFKDNNNNSNSKKKKKEKKKNFFYKGPAPVEQFDALNFKLRLLLPAIKASQTLLSIVFAKQTAVPGLV